MSSQPPANEPTTTDLFHVFRMVSNDVDAFRELALAQGYSSAEIDRYLIEMGDRTAAPD